MDLKQSINRIHGDLLMNDSVGSTVTIKESSSLEFGSHFEMTATLRGATARIVVEKSALGQDVFRWFYYSNPEDATAGLVERVSRLETFEADVMDVLERRRFDSDYLSQIND